MRGQAHFQDPGETRMVTAHGCYSWTAWVLHTGGMAIGGLLEDAIPGSFQPLSREGRPLRLIVNSLIDGSVWSRNDLAIDIELKQRSRR
jgi:hypothetical protein